MIHGSVLKVVLQCFYFLKLLELSIIKYLEPVIGSDLEVDKDS
jgi:hypothetical protein